MSKRIVLVCATMVLLIATAAIAQEGQRKGPGGRGGGGFGGGFGGMGRGGNSLTILVMEEVQNELKVTDDQKKAVTELMEKNRPAGGGFGRRGGGGAEVDIEKAREEAIKRAQEMEKNISEGLGKILNPDQLTRFQQLRIQRDKANALNRADVAEKIGLTAEQKTKISKIQADARAANTGGGGGNFFDMTEEERQKFVARMQEQQQKTETEMIAVLTDTQKASFEEMKGKEFKFPENRGFGGGGGGGGDRKRPERKKA